LLFVRDIYRQKLHKGVVKMLKIQSVNNRPHKFYLSIEASSEVGKPVRFNFKKRIHLKTQIKPKIHISPFCGITKQFLVIGIKNIGEIYKKHQLIIYNLMTHIKV